MTIAKRARGAIPAILALALTVIVLGPRERFEPRWIEPDLPSDLDGYLGAREAGVRALRPGDARGIVWARPDTRAVTPVSLVYLHGFAADRHEVEPLISDLADDLGANAYFARLTGHGRDGAAMAEATAEDWLDDAAEAVAVGDRIGERIVLVGTSTGGTLALWAAARPEARDRIAALILISPNLGPRDERADMVLWPWGAFLANRIVGPEYCFETGSRAQARHSTPCFPSRALLPMMALVDAVRSLEAGVIEMPTLVLYSPEDTLVDPAAVVEVMGRLAGGALEFQVVEGVGDPARHVLAGDMMSPDTTGFVRTAILRFLAEHAGP
jgi:pimeloyl-ACP methyl ester carboxylesterase